MLRSKRRCDQLGAGGDGVGAYDPCAVYLVHWRHAQPDRRPVDDRGNPVAAHGSAGRDRYRRLCGGLHHQQRGVLQMTNNIEKCLVSTFVRTGWVVALTMLLTVSGCASPT